VYIGIENKNAHIDEYFKDQIILSTLNDVVDNINNVIIQMFPKVFQTFKSINIVVPKVGVDNHNMYLVEYLNFLELLVCHLRSFTSRLDVQICCYKTLPQNVDYVMVHDYSHTSKQ